MEALVTALLVWLSIHGHWDVPKERPDIVVEDQKIIQNMSGWGKGVRATALYEKEANRIWLSDDVDLSTVEGKTTLVHELVHWLQDVDPQRFYECEKAKELPAYGLSHKYSRMQGIEPDYNALFIYTQSRCPPPFVPSK